MQQHVASRCRVLRHPSNTDLSLDSEKGENVRKKTRFLLAAKQSRKIEIWRRNKQGTIVETRPKLHLLHKP